VRYTLEKAQRALNDPIDSNDSWDQLKMGIKR
jgi:hypothetical protein